MKKLLMFLCCFFALNATNAFAQCEVSNRCINNVFGMFDSTDDILDANELRTRKELNDSKEIRNCYWCGAKGENGCKNGDMIAGFREDSWVVYTCYEGTGMSDHWADTTNEIKECQTNGITELQRIGEYNSDYDLYSAQDVKTGTERSSSLTDLYIAAGQTFCKQKKTKVITCEGGLADGSSETKPCLADKANADQCERFCKNGVLSDWFIKTCKKGYDLKKPEGKCVKKSQPNPAPTPEPNPVPTPQAVVWNCPVLNFAPYVSCPDADKAIADLKVYCASNESRSQAGYDAMVNLVNVYIKDCEAKQKENDALNQRNKLNSLNSNILGAMDGWKKTLSVWKTSEGDFNTARLASDSIAGVVLGTAGGLITSKVVKKNQVKSGFEDIQCTIGGQKVADWHDEFTVGIQ